MSVLELAKRPLVEFDVNNREHRRLFSKFGVPKKWGHCPVRFALPDDQGHTYNTIQNKLIEWYARKEFGKLS